MQTFLTIAMILFAIPAIGMELTKKSDHEIEALMTGNWFISPVDTFYLTGNAISSYTRGHDIFFVNYADSDCKKATFEASGKWRVKDRQLIITVTESTAPHILPAGTVTVDNIISIDEKNSVLMAPGDNHYQLRTKINSCKIEDL